MLKLIVHKNAKHNLKKKSSFPSATWEGVQPRWILTSVRMINYDVIGKRNEET